MSSSKVHWIQSLRRLDKEPELIILERNLTPSQADTAERKWIAYAQANGWSLTNSMYWREDSEVGEFQDWLRTELEERGWSQNELAKQAGLTSATVSLVMQGHRGVGPEGAKAIAMALRFPPEQVFRKAGLLPPLSDDDILIRITETARLLTPADRDTLLRIAQALAQREPQEAPE